MDLFTYRQNEETKQETITPRSGTPVALNPTTGILMGLVIRATIDSVLRGGEFFCRPDHSTDIHLAQIICTYHRESILRDKIERISQYSKENPWLYDHLEVYIVDNGRTVEPFNYRNIHLLSAPNYGGSAGFTKGIMAAEKNTHTTHFLLNDDDAELDPEVLFRTVAICSILRKELAEAMLGGTMLCLDDPCRTYESGAVYRDHQIHSLNRRLDLTDITANVALEDETVADYFGWWYLVVPRRLIERNGYPLPLFYKIDDVEFGLRNHVPKLTFCGLSVWHPSFASNYSESSVYYTCRNSLILAAGREGLDRRTVEQFVEKGWLNTACLRYLSTDAMIAAVKDFLLGPDKVFRMCQDGPVNISRYIWSRPEELQKELKPRRRASASFFFRKYTLNGLLLPSTGDIKTDFDAMRTEDFYRAGRVLYIRNRDQGTLCRRNLKTAISQLIQLWILKRRILHNLTDINKAYQRALPLYSSEGGWQEIFRSHRVVIAYPVTLALPLMQNFCHLHQHQGRNIGPSHDQMSAEVVLGVDVPSDARKSLRIVTPFFCHKYIQPAVQDFSRNGW